MNASSSLPSKVVTTLQTICTPGINVINMNTIVQLISTQDRQLFEIINSSIISTVISLVGVVGNVMNILVFYKQGFRSTINISFFSLAISDLCGLLPILWYGISVNPLFINSDLPLAPYEIDYLTAGMPHICFSRITGWITVFITAERCLCIMIPLKIKQIITLKVTTITICVIYGVIISSFLPEYATTYIGWKFYPERNRTLLRFIFRSNHKIVEGLVFFLFSIMGSTSFVAVIILTAILIVQLTQKSKWRNVANVDKNAGESISNRERKTVRMVIMIATVLIVCYTPGVAISMATYFEPEFDIFGMYANAFFVSWTFAFVFDAFNSSVNIFLYYNMSTKYRHTFRELFGFATKTLLHKPQQESENTSS